MAGSRTGTSTIWRDARNIARVYQKLGAADLEARTNTAFKDCVTAIVTCVLAILASDDFPLQIDRTSPLGPEDTGGP